MKIGSLVECINDNWAPTIVDPVFCAHIIFPIKGPIYVVRNIITDKDGTGILLEEIVNPVEKFPNGEIGEARWGVSRFRELQPPMDISELISLEKEIVSVIEM